MKEVLLTEMWNKWFHTNHVYLGAFWMDGKSVLVFVSQHSRLPFAL